MSSSLTPEARARYWRKNLSWLGGLLAVWFIVRCVKGFKGLQEKRAPSNVDSWLL